jgi:hypothetical protein
MPSSRSRIVNIARRYVHQMRRGISKIKIATTSRIYALARPSRPVGVPDTVTHGPGGPILIIADRNRPFSRYLAEILLAEGLNSFEVIDVANLNRSTLRDRDLVVVGEVPLGTVEPGLLSEWTNEGGHLVLIRPDARLADLLGLRGPMASLSEAYLEVDATCPPGEGIVAEPMQFHGTADVYEVRDAQLVARLCRSPGERTEAPAVAVREVGRRGGRVAAFTYDLARSVVYTRQGNPALPRRRSRSDAPRRTSTWFRGSSDGATGRDWIDRTRIAIPQADEQQRLLVNVIQYMNRDRTPLPRFWYFPRRAKAVVIMTGDDHGRGGTAGRFESHQAAGPVGDSSRDPRLDWRRVRSTSYVSLDAPLSDSEAAAFDREGFEIGLHVSTRLRGNRGRGADWTPASIRMFYDRQLRQWRKKYPSLPSPVSVRTHSVVWSDWATQARVELEHGIRFDTNYYHWPADWIGGLPGFLTGSGIPMRFADLDGSVIDVYQSATHLTDESGQAYPDSVDTLLDRALGREGFYGAFGVNAHTDDPQSVVCDAVITAALHRGVPVVSARQMLEWLDGRNASSFDSLERTHDGVRFTVRVGTRAGGLSAMIPASCATGPIESVRRDGAAIAFDLERIKGIDYAVFQATAGSYEVTYGSEETAAVRQTEPMAERSTS